ncbi:hypothetical protein [Halorhabdus salina]|uniref:hypothetical protein n=1 Tax=Halorhabdus salina TaxID=2750670 RepID=UPI0015EF8C46|nr:hypothetical protein [Halorhabdus salina]
MRENSSSTTEWGRITRRGLLAVVGTSLFAGCTRLGGLGDGGQQTIHADDLLADPDEDPKPVVSESVPVDIAPDHRNGARSRVRTLLGQLPRPLGPDDIPNGYLREHLSDAASNAATGLDDAGNAPTGLAALTSLQQARVAARYAAAGWGVADRDLTAEPFQREYRQVVSEARSLRDGYEYLGSDPVRAALVHERIEDMLEQVIDSQVPGEKQDLLHVAEWGETAESARVHLADARHLSKQFTASLPADAGTLEEALTEAAETLLTAVRSRRAELPPGLTAEEWGILERAIDDLRGDVDDGIAQIGDANGPASAVVNANRRLTEFQALDRLEGRIDDGKPPRLESAEAVRKLRSTAIDAIEAALAESSVPELTRTALKNAVWRVVATDRRLARHEGPIDVSYLEIHAPDYRIATAIARAAPAVSRQTVETLDRV